MNNLVGKPLLEVIQILKGLGTDLRVVHKDGQDYIITADFRPDRANLKIENDIVTEITWG